MIDHDSYKVNDFIGERLREKRIIMDISQKDLADKIGVTFQQIQKYENGTNRIAAGRLYEISKILNVNIDYFYDGIEHGYEPEKTSKIVLKAISSFKKIEDKKLQKALSKFIISLNNQ